MSRVIFAKVQSEITTHAFLLRKISNLKKAGIRVLKKGGLFLALLGMCGVLAFLSPVFLTTTNLLNVALHSSVNIMIAVGMTFVIASGGIDLSVGSTLAISGMVTADILVRGGGLLAGILGGLITGSICGLSNGYLVTKFKLLPFIATLGMMSVLRGMALIYHHGTPIFGLPEQFSSLVAGYIGLLPIPVIIATVVTIFSYITLRHTKTGKYTVVIGGNERATWLAGINVNRYKLVIYSISGFLAGLGGVVLTARMRAAEPIAGFMYELDAIAAVIMGGTSLMGGDANLAGTVVGALIIGVVRNGLNLLGVQAFYQRVIIGAVVIIAVAVDMMKKKPSFQV